ncbi:MAG: biopolymer transporter ExbD [Chromatiaceae bacterium]|nr:biopolymer transporter ExbD [Gammaproteobacteria bacterium]MCP5445649.1 biopolymer transporter ExbD [Chromatiaceae bacterium]MCB1860627.1 biopolymer transporter ExbD [Gammaproteobacteria bacterium]MCB1872435.1 biopolymer transporter ExbD [Gammaproteobacteria bacterium]MCB1879772.1 biopolymer transporter ExbD [Gammaproteobacteria bacterium]
MNLQPEKKQAIELNLTPLIDVVFLLLIFFMVSTTFDKESRIKVDLPEAATKDEQVAQEKTVLDIIVDAQGRYYVNQREVLNKEPETLKRAIEQAAGDKRDLPVIITADANTTHQSVVIVMDVASQLGLNHMTFSAKKPVVQD